MKTIAIIAAGLAVAACTAAEPQGGNAQEQNASAAAAPAADNPEVRRQLEAANAAYDKALIAGDAAALAEIYTDDFQIIDDDGALHGKQNQIDFMTKTVDLLEARASDVQVTMLGPDSAMVTGRFDGRYRMDGKENDFTERYTSVWVRQGDRWKVRHEHASLVPKNASATAS